MCCCPYMLAVCLYLQIGQQLCANLWESPRLSFHSLFLSLIQRLTDLFPRALSAVQECGVYIARPGSDQWLGLSGVCCVSVVVILWAPVWSVLQPVLLHLTQISPPSTRFIEGTPMLFNINSVYFFAETLGARFGWGGVGELFNLASF